MTNTELPDLRQREILRDPHGAPDIHDVLGRHQYQHRGGLIVHPALHRLTRRGSWYRAAWP